MNRDRVLELLRENKKEIEQFGAYSIGLFGSFARQENKSLSDIDLIIEIYKEKKTFDNFMNIAFFLEDLFGKKVDILTKDSIDSLFFNSIKGDIIYV